MKPLGLACGLIICLASIPNLCPARAAEGYSEAKHFFNIQSRAIGDALNTFAMQADSEILFASELTRDKRTPGLQGKYTNQEALEKLLEGSGLKAEEAGRNVYVVQMGYPSASPEKSGAKNNEQQTQKNALGIVGR